MSKLILRLNNRLALGSLIYVNFDHIVWFEEEHRGDGTNMRLTDDKGLICVEESPEQIMAMVGVG